MINTLEKKQSSSGWTSGWDFAFKLYDTVENKNATFLIPPLKSYF